MIASRRLAVTVVVGAGILGAPAAATAQVTSCADADALSDARLLKPALIAYNDIESDVGPCSGQSQAVIDRKKAEDALKLGKEQLKAGDQKRARSSFRLSAETDASLTEAREQLEQLTGAKHDPRIDEDLAKVGDEGFKRLDNVLRFLLLLLLFAVILRAAVYSLTRIGALRRWLRRQAWLAQERSTLGASKGERRWLWLRRRVVGAARRTTATPLRVEDFASAEKDLEAAAVRDMLRTSMPRIGSRAGSGVDVVTAPFAAPTGLTDVATALKGAPHGSAVAAVLTLLDKVRPRETLHLSGNVLPAGRRGPGLALLLAADNGAAIATVTLWASEFEAPGVRRGATDSKDEEVDEAPPVTLVDRGSRLALAGAVWVTFALLQHRGVLKADDWRRVLGTQEWRSYALVQVAVRDSLLDAAAAERLLTRARDADPGNLTASFNLAVVLMRRERYWAADCLLTAVGEGRPPNLKRRDDALAKDPLRFQVAYNRAALAHHHSLASRPDPQPATKRAVALKGLLCKLVELENALMVLQSTEADHDPDDHALFMLLRGLEGPLLVLWADMATPASDARSRTPIPPKRENLRQHLTDSDPSPVAVVDWAVAHAWMTSRMAYNLACYHARRGRIDKDRREARNEAFKWLAASLPGGVRVDWMQRDPSLETLRTHELARWDRLMEPLGRVPKREGLGQLDAIGRHVAKLNEARITYSSTILARGRTPERRRRLAQETGISPGLLERWARLLTLKGRLKLEYADVNLLDRAGVNSIGALRLVDAEQLGTLLDAAAPGDGSQRPADAILATWVAAATEKPDDIEPAA